MINIAFSFSSSNRGIYKAVLEWTCQSRTELPETPLTECAFPLIVFKISTTLVTTRLNKNALTFLLLQMQWAVTHTVIV